MDNEFTLIAGESGTRVDKFVAENIKGLSRTQVQKLIEDGHIRVNGQTIRVAYKLDKGDRVDVTIPPAPPSPLTAESIPLKIIYEDDDIIVIDKPPGLAVHPSPGHTGGTLVNALLSYYPRIAEITSALRPGIVHRLDKDTSGLMIVAKNQMAQTNLVEQFRARTVEKVYITLVMGHLKPERGIIEADIGRDPHDRKKMTVVHRGDSALTAYRVLKYLDGYTLLEIKPRTGRTHQIRVHLSAIGYPIVGDAVYGVKSPYLFRQFLHAQRLAFDLPSNGKRTEFKSDLPEDLAHALNTLEEKNSRSS